MGADAAVLGHFRAGLRHCGADGRRAALPHAVSADLRDGRGGLSSRRAGRRSRTGRSRVTKKYRNRKNPDGLRGGD